MGMNGFPAKGEKKLSFLLFPLLHSGRRFQIGMAEMGAVFIWVANRTVTTFSARLCESIPEARLVRGELCNGLE